MEEINDMKLTFKKILGADLEVAIFELTDKLNTTTSLFNDVIIQQSRYNQVSRDSGLGILQQENRDLVLDKIRNAIMEIIDRMSIDNLDKVKFEQLRKTEEKANGLIEKEDLKNSLREILIESGYNIQAIVEEKTSILENNVKSEISNLLKRMEVAEIKSTTNEDGNWHLTMAEAFMAKREWEKAAFHFEKTSPYIFDDWQVYFSKSIAYANSRKGRDSDLKALKAYCDAIVFLPTDIDINVKARLFIYRGAMNKRLGRLDESESDIKLGLKYAQLDYEKEDALYNLACIYALKGDKERMIEIVKKLGKKSKNGIKYHLNDYFIKFKDDKDLMHLI